LKVSFKPKPQLFVYRVLKETYPEAKIHPLDVQYHVEPKVIVEDWIKEFPRLRKYVKDAYDCDNFAFWFKAWMAIRFMLNSVGYAEGLHPLGYHAFNVVVVSEGKAYIVEPQAPNRLLDPHTYRVDYIMI